METVELSGYTRVEKLAIAKNHLVPKQLGEHGITKVTVVGLATDYCVKHSALDALREGFEVEIDTEAMRAVNVEPGDDKRAIEEMLAAGANKT